MKLWVGVFEKLVFAVTVFAAVIGVFFCGMRVAGYEPYIVMSSSMEPAIPTGSLLFADTREREVKPGDVVTYWLPVPPDEKLMVTHRIVRKEEDGYVVKGDHNDVPDPALVTEEQVVGVYAFHIPGIGYAAAGFRKREVLIVTMFWLGFLNVASMIFGNFMERENVVEGQETDGDR